MNKLRRKENRREYNASLEDILPGRPRPLGAKIGGRDATTRGMFVPNINLSKWDDACWLNINHPDRVEGEQETFRDKIIALQCGNNTHRMYLIENNSIEYEIELKEKPKSNILRFDLNFSDELQFYYQDTLENEFIKETENGRVPVFGISTLEKYLRTFERPEHIIGSYAVYSKTQGFERKNGKFCHIHRPKLIDANGKERWAHLYIEPCEKILEIECDFSGLEFPVIVDPNIGYTTLPASLDWNRENTIIAVQGTSTATGGDADNGYMCFEGDGATKGGVCSVYNESGGSPASQNKATGCGEANVSVGNYQGKAFYSDTLVWEGISASTNYWAAFNYEAQSRTWYDTAGTLYYYVYTYTGNMPATFSASPSTIGRQYGVYIDYTEDSGPETHELTAILDGTGGELGTANLTLIINSIDETFEAVGFDRVGWVKTETSGSSLDEDFAVPADPPTVDSFGSKCMECDCVSGDAAYIKMDLKASTNTAYAWFWCKLNTGSMAVYAHELSVFLDGSTARSMVSTANDASGDQRFYLQYVNDGGAQLVDEIIVSEFEDGDWVLIRHEYDKDTTTTSLEIYRCDNYLATLRRIGLISTGSMSGTLFSVDHAQVGVGGHVSDNANFKILIDNYKMNRTGLPAVDPITALCRRRFYPTEEVSNSNWSADSGTTIEAIKNNAHYISAVLENALIYYRFEVGDIYSGENVLGARLRFEGQRESLEKRHFRPYLYMSAAAYYGTKANEVDRLTVLPDAAHQLYLEYSLDPTDDSTWVMGDFADIQAGLKICTNDGAGEDLENVEDADPGARINELILELILAPNATDAYMTHWIGFGGVTNNRLRVGVRTNQAAKVRIMYGTVEADVKSSEIGSLDGDTLVTSNPGSNNAISANDFCIHIDITSLTYPQTYYFDVYIDGVSMYEFESGTETYSFWYALPSCDTVQASDVFVAKDIICIGDFHDSPLEHRAFAAMTGLFGKDICMFVRLGDTHSQHSDVLNLQTKDGDASTRVAPMQGCREGWQSRVGAQLPAAYYTEEVKKRYPDEGIYSDHDFVGDNTTKSGHVPRYQRQDGGLPCWQKDVHQLSDGVQIDIEADGGASYSNESVIRLTNQGATANTRINMNVDGYTVEIKGSVSNDGFYIGVTGKDSGAESVIKCGSAVLTNESTIGTHYEEGEDVGLQFEIYQHRTWNALKVFKEYNPSYDYALPVDLTGQATAGSATTLECTKTEYRQFTYTTLTGTTPVVRTYTNGYWVDGNGVDWEAGARTGELVYHNVTDKVMVLRLDIPADVLDTGDTVIELDSNAWNVTGLSNVYTFPTESIYGTYQGMMVYHGTNEELSANLSWSTINSNSGTVLTFNTALRIGSHAFALDDYFRVKRELLCRSFWIGKCQFWIIDIRNKGDREAIIGEGLAGCDWLDGTREFVNAKLSGSCGSPSAGKLIGTGLSAAVEGDVVYNIKMWRMTTSSSDSTNYAPLGTLSVDDVVTWNTGNDGGTLKAVGTDEHGNPELCVLQTSGTTAPIAGDKIEKDGSNYTYVFGNVRNEAQVAKIGGTHTSTQIELEDTYGSGSQTINLFPASGYDYAVYESGGSNHSNKLANEKAGHIQREWLVADMNNSSAEWKFIICETPTYGVLTTSPGNQFQLLPTMDPLDCLRQYLFS